MKIRWKNTRKSYFQVQKWEKHGEHFVKYGKFNFSNTIQHLNKIKS